MEFFLEPIADLPRSLLYVVPAPGVDLSATAVALPMAASAVTIVGGGELVTNVRFQGITFQHTRPTFMDAYEVPSGGDWSIHRGGTFFVDGAEDITVTNCTFLQTGGNALFLSNHVLNAQIVGNTFLDTGDSAIALAGSTRFMDGTAGTYPDSTLVANNFIYQVMRLWVRAFLPNVKNKAHKEKIEE